VRTVLHVGALLALTAVAAHPDNVSVSRDDNESAPNLYIEFEDDDAAAVIGEAELVSEPEAVGSDAAELVPRWRPGWHWGVLPKRYRKVVAGTAALVGLAAAIGDALAAQASQHAAERPSVSVMDAAYSPSGDGNGLDLLLDVADTSPGTVTLTQAQVQQPDLSLNYLGGPIDLTSHQQLEIGLWGQYDCSPPVPGNPGASAQQSQVTQPTTVRLTVRNKQGNTNTVELQLPKGAQLPAPWRDGRTAYCTLAWGG
jgi:hypothetical protein